MNSTSFSFSESLVFLSGYYFGNTRIGGNEIVSKGKGKDAFLAGLPIED